MVLVKVRTLTGKELELVVEKEEKVSEVKERVEEKEGIPPIQQRLIYAGKQMADDKSLEDYGIGVKSDTNTETAGVTLHLVLALRGGDGGEKGQVPRHRVMT